MYKIGLTGPSGAGKTTLANFIAAKLNLEFMPGSASLINDPEAQAFLKKEFDYEPKGHKHVINLSNTNPEFGLEFQKALLKSRKTKLMDNEDFITDRTPLDNTAYFLMQCSHNQPEMVCAEFIRDAQFAMVMGLTHLVLIKPNETWTENNKSRVDNNYYQHMSYAVFMNTYERYFKPMLEVKKIKVLLLDYWDLDRRKENLITFLK